jgi:hypothetical protein
VLNPWVLTKQSPIPAPADVLAMVTHGHEYIKKNMLIKGQIETWTVIVDFNKLKLSEIPKKAMGRILDENGKAYRCGMCKCFILNTTTSQHLLWKFISLFLPSATKQKIKLTKKNTHKDLQALVHHT